MPTSIFQPNGVSRMDMFDRFVLERSGDLQRIARGTRGEREYGDVVNEAWLMARTLAAKHRIAIDFADPAFQKMLLSYLYQHLVRYTDTTIRFAVRLDHSPGQDTDRATPHPLLNMLTNGDADDPLSLLLASENRPVLPLRADEQHSLASAYLVLLKHLGNRMHSLAKHLLISPSYAYRCCAKARGLVARQHALLLMPPVTAASLKPWRRQRALRIPRQIEFDFADRLPFANAIRDDSGAKAAHQSHG